MWAFVKTFWSDRAGPPCTGGRAGTGRSSSLPVHFRLSAKQRQGQHGEQRALAHLLKHGLRLVETNFRCKSGEIDLILRDGEALVFVEVRQRTKGAHGGAAASITPAKIDRVVRAAQTYLLRFERVPPCRIDVVAIDGDTLDWLRDAIQV